MKYSAKTSLAAAATAVFVFTTSQVLAADLLAIDIGAGPVEAGFVGQSTTPATHATAAGDVTVAFSGQQGFFNFIPPSTTGSNVDFYQDFIFKNGGTMTMTISGPGISASTDYVLSFWTQYQAQPRNTTFAPSAGTTGPNLGPIANTNLPATGLADPEHFISGTYTSDSSGVLTILVGGTGNRPALNGLKIETIGGGPVDPRITSITSVGGGLWELTLKGDADTAYEFRSSTILVFDPGTLVVGLTQGDSGDPGTVGPPNDSRLTTDGNGDGKVRMTLSGNPADFVRAQTPLPLFSEDFESGDGGFTAVTTGGTPWAYGTPNSPSQGGGAVTTGNGGSAKCWGTNIGSPGGYLAGTDTSLRSPVIDLTGVAAATLSFAQALDIAPGHTLVVNVIEAATDTVLQAAVHTSTPDTDILKADWKTVPAVAITGGQPVRIEWRFSGDGDGTYLGAYIDDVVVTAD